MDLVLDFSAFTRRAAEMGAQIDQVPFALAQTLNTAARNARQVIWTDTWPTHVAQRNPSFIRAAFNITEYALKHRLVVTLGETKTIQGRAHLALHAEGGVKQSRKRLAIPPAGTVTRTARGVRQGQRPRDIIDSTPRRALRVTPRGIFVGEGGRLHLRYAFAASARQPADVPFGEVFITVMTNELRTEFPRAMAKAMETRR